MACYETLTINYQSSEDSDWLPISAKSKEHIEVNYFKKEKPPTLRNPIEYYVTIQDPENPACWYQAKISLSVENVPVSYLYKLHNNKTEWNHGYIFPAKITALFCIGTMLIVTLDTCAIHFIDSEIGLDIRPPIMTYEVTDHIKMLEDSYLMFYSNSGFIQIFNISDILKIKTIFTKKFIRQFTHTDEIDITYELNTYDLSIVIKSPSYWATWSNTRNCWVAICNENNSYFETDIKAQTIAEIENLFTMYILNCVSEGIKYTFLELITAYLHTNKAKALNLFKQIFQRQAEGCQQIGGVSISDLFNQSMQNVQENFPELEAEIMEIKGQFTESIPQSREPAPIVGEKERGPLIVYEKDEYYIDDEEIAKRNRQKTMGQTNVTEALQLYQLRKFQYTAMLVQQLFASTNMEEFNQRALIIRDIDTREALAVVNSVNVVPAEFKEALLAYNGGLRTMERQRMASIIIANYPMMAQYSVTMQAMSYENQQAMQRQALIMQYMETRWAQFNLAQQAGTQPPEVQTWNIQSENIQSSDVQSENTQLTDNQSLSISSTDNQSLSINSTDNQSLSINPADNQSQIINSTDNQSQSINSTDDNKIPADDSKSSETQPINIQTIDNQPNIQPNEAQPSEEVKATAEEVNKTTVESGTKQISPQELFQQQKQQEYYRYLQAYYSFQHQMQQMTVHGAQERFLAKMCRQEEQKHKAEEAEETPQTPQQTEVSESPKLQVIKAPAIQKPKSPKKERTPVLHQQLLNKYMKKPQEKNDNDKKELKPPVTFTLPIINGKNSKEESNSEEPPNEEEEK